MAEFAADAAAGGWRLTLQVKLPEDNIPLPPSPKKKCFRSSDCSTDFRPQMMRCFARYLKILDDLLKKKRVIRMLALLKQTRDVVGSQHNNKSNYS
jgi:hypothetical protein